MSFLELHSVTKRFGGLKAVNEFSLSLGKGSLTALIGPNGCGKSTIFNLISGTFAPTGGTIYFDGIDVTPLSAEKIAQMGVGRKFQVPAIFSELTVSQNLKVPTLQSKTARSRKDAQKPLAEIMSLIRLTEKSDWIADQLSHGEKQWLEIGMILAQSPKLILLDEPTAGMTLTETIATAELIKKINTDGDVTVLVIEHDIGFIEQLQCPLTVMARGSILKSGDFEAIRGDKEVQELYFGSKGSVHA
ncbi:MAG: ABC transporter ATP-binding protein [Sneathiella sp.]|nr:ABC transporter ATP-binding protein [Sneathiella sp.]